jgi:hypothetical protein
LLVRRGDRIETPLGVAPEFYDFSGFEPVEGVMMPKKIVRSRADYQVTCEVSQIAQK